MSDPVSTTPISGSARAAESAAVEPENRPVIVVEEDDTESDSDAMRRRRRRRRRRSLKSDSPEKRIRTFLLLLVFALLILAVTGAQAGEWLKSMLASAKSSGQFHGIASVVRKLLRWEVLALVIAAVILVYLQPGVEDKVLRAIGIKKDRRRR